MQSRTKGLAVLALLVFFGPVAAQTAKTSTQAYDEFNDGIHRELLAIDPDAEASLRAADDARSREDHRAAADLYARTLEKVPTFVHALRRQAFEEMELGDRPKAFGLFRQAIALDRSADNLAAFAAALVWRTQQSTPSSEDLALALTHAREALALAPDSVFVLTSCAQVALANSDRDLLGASVAGLLRVEPDSVNTLYFQTIAIASLGKFNAAEASLERAHAAGLPDDAYRSLRASINNARPLGPRLARWGAIAAGIWLACAVVLLMIGSILSKITLHASARVPPRPEAGASGLDAFLRRVYRLVLWACCAYYYLSMPVLLALVLVIGGGIVYGFLAVGHVPIKLVAIIVGITVVTAWSILKSVIVRRKDEDPGIRLDLDGQPALRAVLVDVANRVGTRPVDSVYMTPGTEIAVFERGGLLRQLGRRTERCLILGVGALDGMRLAPFRAVLAHEYGHFSNRDTAGGGFALAVRMSAVSLARNLAASGAADWYNPAWLFVNGFHLLFLRISQGASRLQEVLADRWAAILYGAQAFEDGLRHVIDRSVRFDVHVRATLQEVVDTKRPLTNLYTYAPSAPIDAAALDANVSKVLEREPSPYDSHPRPTDRFRWVHALGIRAEQADDDVAPVWGLFADRGAIEERMTGFVRANVQANHGVTIAG
jgi:Zn-dependent protease with chaperone function